MKLISNYFPEYLRVTKRIRSRESSKVQFYLKVEKIKSVIIFILCIYKIAFSETLQSRMQSFEKVCWLVKDTMKSVTVRYTATFTSYIGTTLKSYTHFYIC